MKNPITYIRGLMISKAQSKADKKINKAKNLLKEADVEKRIASHKQGENKLKENKRKGGK